MALIADPDEEPEELDGNAGFFGSAEETGMGGLVSKTGVIVRWHEPLGSSIRANGGCT